MAVALEKITGTKPLMVWHQDYDFDAVDFIALPGGFSYGDYLRCGAMSARSHVMKEVIKRAESGVPTFGVCNGFQILTESGLLPGALMLSTLTLLAAALLGVPLRVRVAAPLLTTV